MAIFSIRFLFLFFGLFQAEFLTYEDKDLKVSFAYGFGVDKRQAEINRAYSFRDYNDTDIRAQIDCNNSERMAEQWYHEQRFIFECWSALDNALNEKWSIDSRLFALELLRGLLGVEAFNKRQMPRFRVNYKVNFLP